jgi:hypothetical protein
MCTYSTGCVIYEIVNCMDIRYRTTAMAMVLGYCICLGDFLISFELVAFSGDR